MCPSSEFDNKGIELERSSLSKFVKSEIHKFPLIPSPPVPKSIDWLPSWFKSHIIGER